MRYVISESEMFVVVVMANPNLTMPEAHAQAHAQVTALKAIRETHNAIKQSRQTFGDMITQMEHSVAKHKATQA